MSYSSEVLADAPLIYWRLGEANGAVTAADASGNGHAGAYAYGTRPGSPRLTLGTPGLLTGDADTAATFAGLNYTDAGGVQIAHAAWMDVSAITLECWIKTTATGFQMLWDRDPGTGARPWQYRLNNGKFEFVRTANASGALSVVTATSTITVNDGNRHHLAATYDGTTIKLYIDGALNKTVTASGGLCTVSTDGLRFGWSPGGAACYTSGVADELAYYGTALSATRIAAHYTAATSTPGPSYSGTLAARAQHASASLAGTYAAPTPPRTGTLAATASPASASLSGLYAAPGVRTGTLAAIAPKAAVALTGTYTHTGGNTGVLDVTSLPAFAALSGTYTGTIGTNTANRAGGRKRSGKGLVTVEPGMAVPPNTLSITYPTDVAIPLPDPMLVKGRPTNPDYIGANHRKNWITKPGGRDRILVGGVDITYYRDVPVQTPTYGLQEPFAYAESTLTIPQRHRSEGSPKWAHDFAKVAYQRVFEDGTVVTDYRGEVQAIRWESGVLTLDVAGQVSGPANLADEQPPLRFVKHDVGWWTFGTSRQFCHMLPRFGPITGVRIAKSGQMTRLAWLQQLGTMSQIGGQQRALMPVPGSKNLWRFDFKDTTSVDFTIFLDGARASESLVDDVSEKPNTFYGTGVTSDGMRWRNARYPEAMDGDKADFPMRGGATFGIGTKDADTRDGSGITVMQIKLQWSGYLEQREYDHGTYDSVTAAGVKRLQRDVHLPRTGTMDTKTWNRLWNADATGTSLKAAHIAPLVQDPRVPPWIESQNGSIVAPNPDRVSGSREVSRTYDFGSGIAQARATDWCEDQMDKYAGKNWAGSITVTGGAGIFAGKWELGQIPPASAVMSPRDIRPGMNAYLPGFDGGTIVHVAGSDVTPATGTSPVSASLTVDTLARDLMELQQVIARNRASRRNIRREWNLENRSHGPSNNRIEFDQYGGVLSHDRRLQGGKWNAVDLVCGQTGILERVDLLLNNRKAEFCFAIASHRISPTKARRRFGNPFVVNSDGESWVEIRNIQDLLDDKILLYVAGDGNQPCGYDPRRKFSDKTDPATGDPIRTSAPITGRYRDDAGVPYKTPSDRVAIVRLLIYPDRDCTLQSGRLLYKSEDDAV